MYVLKKDIRMRRKWACMCCLCKYLVLVSNYSSDMAVAHVS